MQRILEAAAGHVRGHTVALAAALPGLLADAAELVAPPPPLERPPVPRRPAVPVASPFAATRPPAGLRSPSATPGKGTSGSGDGCGGGDLRRGSVASHAGHAQLLPRFDSEAGSSAALGGSQGFGSLELPAQDSQQLSGFDRIDSVRMPSFSDNFRTTRAVSGQGGYVASGLVFSSSRVPSDVDSVTPLLPSFMQRRHGPGASAAAATGADAGEPARPLEYGPPMGSPIALGRAGSSSTTRPQRLGLGGLIAGRESSHSLQHYLDDSQVRTGRQLELHDDCCPASFNEGA